MNSQKPGTYEILETIPDPEEATRPVEAVSVPIALPGQRRASVIRSVMIEYCPQAIYDVGITGIHVSRFSRIAFQIV